MLYCVLVYVRQYTQNKKVTFNSSALEVMFDIMSPLYCQMLVVAHNRIENKERIRNLLSLHFCSRRQEYETKNITCKSQRKTSTINSTNF